MYACMYSYYMEGVESTFIMQHSGYKKKKKTCSFVDVVLLETKQDFPTRCSALLVITILRGTHVCIFCILSL